MYILVYLFTFREKCREGESEGEKQLVASGMPTNGELAHNPGKWLDHEWNQQPFSLQDGAQCTDPHQSCPYYVFLKIYLCFNTLKPDPSN